jgi:cardiolipin synthase A/B
MLLRAFPGTVAGKDESKLAMTGICARYRRLVLALIAALAVAACAAVPNGEVEDAIDASGVSHPRVVGLRGPLSEQQSRAIIERLRRQSGNSDVLQRHIALEQALSASPLIADNTVRPLRDGPETFAAMFAAIDGAVQSLELEYFTFEDVELNGRQLGDLLVDKAARGVRISILYDAAGSIATPAAFLDRLRQAGIALVEFNPLQPLTLNHRDHRKILIADNAVAIVGGVNLSTVYSSLPLSKTPPRTNPDRWRDTDLAIAGPAVYELQRIFLDSWSKQSGPQLATPLATTPVATGGHEIVRILGSTPDDRLPLYYIALLSAIRNAEQRIWISAAYFVPTHEALEDLSNAARRGVDVRLLLPSRSDSSMTLAAGRSHYGDLLEAGVKIFEARDVILHAKSVAIDGVWSSIGSSNFDRRSVLFNDEVDAVILGGTSGARMEAIFDDDFKQADRIDPAAWRERPLAERFDEIVARLFWEYWL